MKEHSESEQIDILVAKLQILMKIRTLTILWEKTISKNRDTQESSIQAMIRRM